MLENIHWKGVLRMSEEFDEDGNPERWDEFEWEKFMKERDADADKLSRFMDEHIDDPNLDSLIAREMGWIADDSTDNGEKGAENFHFFSEDEPEDEGEEWKAAAGIADEGAGRSIPDFQSDTLYRKAFDLAVDLTTWWQGLPQNLKTDPDIAEARSQALLPAAKIANGWGDDNDNKELLGYRVAAYKRGLAAANRALELMGRIRERKMLDENRLIDMINRATEVRNGLAVRVLEVRDLFNRK